MSEEPQPLRLNPRPPPAEGPPPAPGDPGAPPPPQAPGAGPADGTGRLRLRPRLSAPDDAGAKSAAAPAMAAPPPPPPAAPPIEEPIVAAAEPEPEEAPAFKLRPKGAAPAARAPVAPPPPPAGAPLPPVPLPVEAVPVPEPPMERSSTSMPPMSILAAPLPPQPGAVAEAPAPPGSAPRLSLGPTPVKPPVVPGKPPASVGTIRRVADFLPKIGGKKAVVKPGKPSAVLRKRSALSPMAKAGLTVVAVAVGVGGFYSYRIFFPAPTPDVRIKHLAIAKPLAPVETKKPAADAAAAKPTAAPGQAAEKAGATGADQHEKDQAKADSQAPGQDAPTPTPTQPPDPGVVESVLGDNKVSQDVRVGSTPIDAGRSASPAFRSFVAGAVIGGVYQGTPSRALVNGTIVREGQTVDSALGIAFERIDANRKIIFFKDYTGAEVSKGY
jgi:hypothetical protein